MTLIYNKNKVNWKKSAVLLTNIKYGNTWHSYVSLKNLIVVEDFKKEGITYICIFIKAIDHS